MSRDNCLPFERGATAYGGDATLITAAGLDHLCGKRYRVNDTVFKTSREVWLRILKNSSGGNITADNRGVKPATGKTGRETAGFVSAAGGFGYLIDSLYLDQSTVIKNGDLFYVVDRGPAKGLAGGANIADSAVIVFDSSGYLTTISSGNSARSQYVVGRSETAVTSASQGDAQVNALVGDNYADQDTSA